MGRWGEDSPAWEEQPGQGLGWRARPWGLAAGRPCLGSDRRGQDRDPGDPSASPAFRRELSWVRTWKEEARTLLPAEPGPHASAPCTPARSTSCEPPGQMSWPMDAHNVSIPFSIRGGGGGSRRISSQQLYVQREWQAQASPGACWPPCPHTCLHAPAHRCPPRSMHSDDQQSGAWNRESHQGHKVLTVRCCGL